MSDESAAIALVSANEAYKATKSFIQDALASSSYSNNSYSNYNSNSDNNNTVSIKRVVEIKFIGHNNQIDKGFSRCSRTANQHKIKFSDNTTRYIYQITKEESGCFGKLNEWVYLSTNWGGGIKGSTKEELIEKINKYYND